MATAPTPDQINWYTTGYQDGKLGKAPAYVPAPLVNVIPPTADLTTVLNALAPNSKVQLVAGGKYTCPKPVILPAGVSLDCNDALISFTATPGVTSLFSVSNPNCEVFGLKFNPAPSNNLNVLFRVTAPGFWGHDCDIDDGLASVSVTNVGGTKAMFSNLTCGKTYSETMYSEESNTQWSDSTFAGSINETTVRQSPSPTGVIPTGLSVINCVIYGGGANKGSMELRTAKNAKLTNCTFHDYIRCGQKTATALNQWGGATIDNCVFDIPTGTLPQLLISSGFAIVGDSDTFFTAVTTVGVSEGAWSTIALTNSVRQLVPSGITGYRPNLIATAVSPGGPSYPKMIETNTVVK